ncbi:Subtilisin-like protease SBT3.5 [Vitis vinifera]|uniref:Subtilisin-like protease SBT3.5 n=1 Tax=Vitis vinifera TaxID=29760 RepID=A0A438BV06_VITVI|nr:Subtilisin-like protease SBT3.5 [Vitis vinifera]
MSNSTPFFALFCLLFALAQAEARTNVHIVYLGERQHNDPELVRDSHHDMLASIVGSKEVASELMVYSYKHGFSGFAAKLTESQAQRIAGIFLHISTASSSDPRPLIKVAWCASSHPNSLHQLQQRGAGITLACLFNLLKIFFTAAIWGDGVIIGVLDTGIWPESKSFNDEGLDRSHLSGRYGQPLNTSGNQEFLSPRDANGHGTHTSSTAGGSFVGNVSYKGLALGTVRGGAPHARLAIYKVCWNVLGGQCSSADILKAFDEAINDGVHVLSLSIGSSIPLFSDIDERDGIATGFLPCTSTMDRAFPTPITLGNNKTLLGQALFTGKETGFSGLYIQRSQGFALNSAGCEALSLDQTSSCWKSGALLHFNAMISCVEVDYEIGTRILYYIRSTRLPVVNLSPSKTFVGEAVLARMITKAGGLVLSSAQANP